MKPMLGKKLLRTGRKENATCQSHWRWRYKKYTHLLLHSHLIPTPVVSGHTLLFTCYLSFCYCVECIFVFVFSYSQWLPSPTIRGQLPSQIIASRQLKVTQFN